MAPKRHLPLNSRVFALLIALADGPAHGYALKTAVESASGRAILLDAGSLYRHLSKLVDDGLVEEVAAPAQASSTDPRRRYYALTPTGRAVVAAEARRLRNLLPRPDRIRALEGK